MTQARRRRPERRVWDSSTILAYLGGETDFGVAMEGIVELARQGNIQILVSTLATIEVAYLRGLDSDVSEDIIVDFFNRDFVIPIAIDARISAVSRGLVRKYGRHLGLGPHDAAHLATSIVWNVPVLEAVDSDLLQLDGREGQPPISVRTPLYEGSRPLPGMS